MANTPRSSFIPRQVAGVTPKTIRQKRVFSVFGFLAIALLLGSVLAAGGIFLYKIYLERQLSAEKDNLQAEYARFDESDLASIRTFDKKLELIDRLLDNHVAPSKIFDALEAHTKQSVRYGTFSYARRPSGDITLSITGATDDFAKVSLQWMEYLRNSIFADAVLTRVGFGTVDESEDVEQQSFSGKQVGFNLVVNIPASSVQYIGDAGMDTQETDDTLEQQEDAGVVATSTARSAGDSQSAGVGNGTNSP